MTRLHTQHQRLYLTLAHDATERSLADAQGRVRALVLGLGGPADWSVLGAVWRGVQADLDLPAPGIAVSGESALQLWFSLAEPVAPALGEAFLSGLQQRYLADVKAARVQRLAGTLAPDRLPPVQTGPERWSAFVASDLAAVFAEDPALDFQPGADAQAELLSRLASVSPAAFESALVLLQPVEAGTVPTAPEAATPQPEHPGSHPGVDGAEPHEDPRRFLQAVMNDRGVPMALRIEAAKALLPPVHGA
ncbi:MAG: hypothetical protein Q8K24_03515 [Hydrogenophaga sp.]|nr:hypothetical protein [Hydrogenophaga sp.]